MTPPLPIFLLTDFGTSDTYVGQVKAVLSARAPGAALIDLTHEVSPYAIDEGAWLLETALPVIPAPAVVLAVVDPGVGSERLPIAVRVPDSAGAAAARYFVGPDNGLLSPAVPPGNRPAGAAPAPVPEGLAVRALENPAARLEAVSATFHGRDLFAPAAAWLAAGKDYQSLGPARDRLTLLPPFAGFAVGEAVRGFVVHVDRYGNLVTTIRKEQLPARFTLEVNGCRIARAVRTFSDGAPGELACHVDSSGFLAVAQREGSAAARTGAALGDAVTLEPR